MDPFLAQLKDIPSRELTIHYMNHCMELAEILKNQGITLEAYNHKGLAQFSSLSLIQKEEILNAAQAYLNQLRSVLNASVELRGDNRKHAWWALKNMDLIPPNDLFDKIGSTDLIEIYNSECKQVFRSFELYEHISYSISEIFSHTWMELFERDEFITKRVLEEMSNIFSGIRKGVFMPNIPPHIVTEKFSEKKKWIKMENYVVSTLNDKNDSLAAFITAFKITDYGVS